MPTLSIPLKAGLKLIWLFPVSLLGILLFQCLSHAWIVGQTVDEAYYNGTGYPIVRYNNYSTLGEHPPLMIQLGALPLLALRPTFEMKDVMMIPGTTRPDISVTGTKFLYEHNTNPYLILFLERLPVIAVTVLLACIVFLWSVQINGWGGGLLSLFLLSVCPNIIAHGSLYTTDMGATAFFFIGVYSLKKFLDRATLKTALLAELFIGLALLTKISTLLLLPLSLMLFAASLALRSSPLSSGIECDKDRLINRLLTFSSLALFILSFSQKIILASLGPLLITALSLCAESPKKSVPPRISILVRVLITVGWTTCLLSAILLNNKHSSLSIFSLVWVVAAFILNQLLLRRTGRHQIIRDVKMFLLMWMSAAVIVILGYTDFYLYLLRFNPFEHYLNNFLWSLGHIKIHHAACLSGSWVTCDWSYFTSVLMIKTPLPSLFLFALGILSISLSQISRLDKVCVLLPPVIFFIIASFGNRINIGMRHILPIFPFLFLIAGSTVPAILQIPHALLRKAARISLAGILASSFTIAWKTFPDYLPYFNAVAGGSENAARLVADSNLAWGQDNKKLAQFIREKNFAKIKIGGMHTNAAEFNYHRIPWAPMAPEDFNSPAPGYYALDLNYYAAEQKREKSWFKDRKPIARAAKTFYIFKV